MQKASNTLLLNDETFSGKNPYHNGTVNEKRQNITSLYQP